MSYSFIAYIDESGDDGLSGHYRIPGKGGASHWLTLSASIWRYSRDLEALHWRDEIRQKVYPNSQKKTLHCVDLDHQKKVVAAQILSQKALRIICVISNKPSIPQGTYADKNQLYFYMCRYLLERISWFCRDQRPVVPEGDGKVKIVFSRRGGMSYDDFRDYLDRLRASGDDQIKINWTVVDIPGIEAVDHSTRAGLQLADIAATCMTAGLEPDFYGNCELRYAQMLKPVVYQRQGNYLSYGLKIVPKPEDLQLNEQQAQYVSLFKK